MLEIVALESGYGPIQVLDRVSMRIPKGKIISVVGSNGAGKTTLLRTLAGLVRTVQGTIFLDGEPIQNLPAYVRVERGLSLVPEGRQLFPLMSVMDNLLVAATPRRAYIVRKQSLTEVFAAFPILEKRTKQLAGTLSGGEQQMLALGRGLMARPTVLLLDEPSLGLAPLVVKDIFRVVAQLRTQGYTILLIEQNLHQALAISDYAYVLENGAISLQSTPQEILENEYTRHAYIGM